MSATIIGASMLYYAIMTTEDTASSSAVYATPQRIEGLVSISVNPNPSTETLFADNGALETSATLGNIEVEINATGLTNDVLAALLGHTVDGDTGVLESRSDDTPPWVAIGFKALKSNGEYRYVWLVKGKFQVNENAYETKGDSINFQVPSIIGSFVKRNNDDIWKKQSDTDDDTHTLATDGNWFVGSVI